MCSLGDILARSGPTPAILNFEFHGFWDPSTLPDSFFFSSFSNFFISFFLIYILNAIPKVPHTIPPLHPYPPIPNSWPWCSPVLGI